MEILERSLSEIATTIPDASALLLGLELNYCSQGRISLKQALASKDIDSAPILAQLTLLSAKAEVVDWTQLKPTKLISHILERYHARHREQLPELISLATKVERVHSSDAHCPAGLAELLRDIYYELNNHMMKEEQILFPMLAGGIYPIGPINVMQDEHDNHLDTIERIKALTAGVRLPEQGACNSWKNLYKGLQIFIDDLMQHIALENYFLFEQPSVID